MVSQLAAEPRADCLLVQGPHSGLGSGTCPLSPGVSWASWIPAPDPTLPATGTAPCWPTWSLSLLPGTHQALTPVAPRPAPGEVWRPCLLPREGRGLPGLRVSDLPRCPGAPAAQVPKQLQGGEGRSGAGPALLPAVCIPGVAAAGSDGGAREAAGGPSSPDSPRGAAGCPATAQLPAETPTPTPTPTEHQTQALGPQVGARLRLLEPSRLRATLSPVPQPWGGAPPCRGAAPHAPAHTALQALPPHSPLSAVLPPPWLCACADPRGTDRGGLRGGWVVSLQGGADPAPTPCSAAGWWPGQPHLSGCRLRAVKRGGFWIRDRHLGCRPGCRPGPGTEPKSHCWAPPGLLERNKAWPGPAPGPGVLRSAQRAVQAAFLGLKARCSPVVPLGLRLFHFPLGRGGSCEGRDPGLLCP